MASKDRARKSKQRAGIDVTRRDARRAETAALADADADAERRASTTPVRQSGRRRGDAPYGGRRSGTAVIAARSLGVNPHPCLTCCYARVSGVRDRARDTPLLSTRYFPIRRRVRFRVSSPMHTLDKS